MATGKHILKTQTGFSYALLILVVLALSIVGYASYKVYQKKYELKLNQGETQDMDKSASFSFAAAGDFSDNENASNVITEMGRVNSDLILALGDLGYVAKGKELYWCDFVKDRVGPDIPFELIIGNHDDATEKSADIMVYRQCLPNKIEGMVGDYAVEYYFDYMQLARFILISPDISNYGYDYIKGNRHYEWVADAIDDARNRGVKWIILGMHKNCITPGVKSCEIGEDIMNLALEKGVDIVLQGHEHAYFRSKQLALSSSCPGLVRGVMNTACIAAGGNSFSRGSGAILAIVGTGGMELRDANPEDSEIGYFDAINGSDTSNANGFLSFRVSSASIKAQFITIGHNNFYDSFTITD